MISIVIPCYNEADWIEKTYKQVKSELEKLKVNYEIIIEQDGSTDGTDKIIENLSKKDKKLRSFSFEKRRGKGYGLRFCFEKAKGDIIMMDADLAAGKGFIKQLLNSEGDIVILSGYERGFNIRGSLSLLYKSVILLFFGLNLDYVQSGFKKINKRVLKNINFETSSMSFDTEIVFKAKKEGYKIKEVKGKWNQRKKRSFGVLEVGKMFIDVIRLKFFYG